MPVSVEVLDKWKRRLRIGVPEDSVERKMQELFDALAKRAEAPGFRRGKVPRSLLERRHGEAVRNEALEALMGPAYADAVRETGLRPIGDPIVERVERVPSGGHYHFTATVEVRPEIELREYEGLQFTERIPKVTGEDVDRAIEELRERHAELVSVGRPAMPGDFVIIDYDRLGDDGEPIPETTVLDYPCEVGSGRLPPELDGALVGASVGDSKTVAIAYPDDYGVESMAGRTISFGVRVKDVKEKRLPPVDDAFARVAARAETVLDLRVKVRNSLEAQAKAFARRRLEEEIVATLVARNPFELPEGLVQKRLDALRERLADERGGDGGQTDPTEFERIYRPMVEHQLKAGLILGAIAEKHNVEVTSEEVERRVARLAEARGKDPDELLRDLKDTKVLAEIEDDLWLAKVHDLIVGLSKVETEYVDIPGNAGGEPEKPPTDVQEERGTGDADPSGAVG